MSFQPSHYHSFLIRIWRDNGTSAWRVQLEDPHSGERRGFPSLEKMIEFLAYQMEEAPSENNTSV